MQHEKDINELRIQLKEAEIRQQHYKEMYEKEREEKESLGIVF